MGPQALRVPSVPGEVSGLAHQPGLDGLRGLGVMAVLAYHLGWIRGGFLGVSLFFTLSGFLITNLLLQEREGAGRVRLGAFWGRRARRLLPAALAGVGLAVVVSAAVGTPDQLQSLPGDVVGALGYVANWRFVLAHSSYRAGFAAPSPLLHYWSLAIEEQLYLVVPLLVVVAMWGRASRRALVLSIVALMALSAAATLKLGSGSTDRIYFGTDTRMFELLAGALLATVIGFPGTGPDGLSARGRLGRLRRSPIGLGPVGPNVAGLVALVATAGLWGFARQSDRWLSSGGFWLVASLSCALIVGACWGGSLRALLSARILTGAGRISYGLYVYHWSIFMALGHTGLHGFGLAALRLAVTVLVAAASFRWLETPVRRGRTMSGSVALVAAPIMATAIALSAVFVSGPSDTRAIAPVSPHELVLAPPSSSASRPLPSPGAPGPSVHQPFIRATPPESLTPTAPEPPRGPAAMRRILFMGDSLMQQAFPTLAQRLRHAGIETRVIGGNGESLMTHDGAWLGQLTGAVNDFDPDMVVLESCCGQFRFDTALVGADGQAIAPESGAFAMAWRGLALRASRAASARGALVAWVLGPAAHTNGWYGPIDAQIDTINAIYRSLGSCGPRTTMIAWGRVGGPGGTYADSLVDVTGHTVQVRQSDGFHFTPAGIDALSDVTLPELTRAWAAGGRPGPWPNACP